MADAETPKKQDYKKPLILLVAGVVLSFAGCLIAQAVDLAPKLQLDIRGGRAVATAEEKGDGGYILRYKHPGGTIYRRQYKGRLGGESVEDGSREVQIAYDMNEPETFQPWGMSLAPGLGAGLCFFAGLACVFRARRTMRGPLRLIRTRNKQKGK